MILRDIEISDVDNIVDSIMCFMKEMGVADKEMEEKAIRESTSMSVNISEYKKVVCDGESILGGIMLFVDKSSSSSKLEATDDIWWTSNKIGKIKRIRVASMLLREACRWCVKENINKISLNMLLDTESTRKLLRKIGFFEERRTYSFNLGGS